MDSLPQRLLWLLSAAGVSARTLDVAAGLPRSATYRATRGQATEATLRAIAETLGVSVAWLRYGTDYGAPAPAAATVGARGAAIRLGGAL
jgi:hypothetical protein